MKIELTAATRLAKILAAEDTKYEAKLRKLLEKTPKVQKQLDSYAEKEGIKMYRHDPVETYDRQFGVLGFKRKTGEESERFSAIVNLDDDSIKVTQWYGGKKK